MEQPPQFDTVRFVYTWSAAISFVAGMLLNLTLIWLIMTKTVKAMLMYSRLLLHSCVMDILIVIVSTLVQPIPNGFFRHVSQPYAYMLNILWIQLLLFFLASTTAQFIFRYYLLDGKIPRRLVWLMVMAAFLLNLFHIILLVWADYPREEYYPRMEELTKQVHAEAGIADIKFSSFTYARSFPWLVHCVVMVVLFSTCYAIIGVCAIKIRRYVGKTFSAGCSTTAESCPSTTLRQERMREYNNQITSALIVQAILPTFEVIAMSTQILLPIFYPGGTTVFIIVYTAIPLYFAPVLNPLATILLVKPYRRALFNKIVGRRGQVTSTGYANTDLHGNRTQATDKVNPIQSFTAVGPNVSDGDDVVAA